MKDKFFKVFSFLYYPLQYLIVKWCLFGFGKMSLANLFIGLNIDVIIKTAVGLWELFPALLIAENFLIFLIFLIIKIIQLLWVCRKVIIYACTIFSLLRYVTSLLNCCFDVLSVTLDKQVLINNGAPGTGKTRLLVFFSVIMAYLMWCKLRWRIWRDKPKIKKWQKQGKIQKIIDYEEAQEAYKYYSTPQRVKDENSDVIIYPIPCLFSNIGIRVGKKYSSKLNFNHAIQKEKLPSYTVSMWSEFGATFNIEYSTNKNLEMSDDLRFCRQFRENIICGDEQESGNVAIDARRVVSDVNLLNYCKHILKPLVLIMVFKPFQILFSKIQKGNKLFSPALTFLEELINKVGFVKFKYLPEGSNMHKRIKRMSKTFKYPLCTVIAYDTRAFRNLYNSKNKDLKCAVHSSLTVENTTANREAFLRHEFENRPPASELEFLKKESDLWDIEILKDKLKKYHKEYPEKAKNIASKLNDTDLSL